MHEVKVGSRVMFRKTGIRGAIIGFVLDSHHPFHVRWDRGSDDWYSADQLVLCPVEKQADPIDEHLAMLRGFIDGQDDDVALMFQPLVDFLINLQNAARKAINPVSSEYPPELWDVLVGELKSKGIT